MIDELLTLNILPIRHTEKKMVVGVIDDTALDALKTLAFRSSFSFEAEYMEPELLICSVNEMRRLRLYLRFSDSKSTEENSILPLVDTLLSHALSLQASDIHIEPFPTHCQIRFRVDGLLQTIVSIAPHYTPLIINHFKILSHLNIAEKRLPLDGRFFISIPPFKEQACRISTCPTLHGEKIVIRFLKNPEALTPLDEIGLTDLGLEQTLNALQIPQGLILVTGPTGSGKTSTLYAALQYLNHEHSHLITIEDPIEMPLPGVNQVAVNPVIGLDFSTALRAFLRQDPDTILVGEIRDAETAHIAIRAAHTGHRVLSTLHTNHALDALARLQHLGVDRFQLSSTLLLIIAQRLIRILCPFCKEISEVPSEFSSFFLPQQANCYTENLAGCPHCLKGFKGRRGIFEILPITEAIRHQLFMESNSDILLQLARKNGFKTLLEQGLVCVAEGITSLSEVMRVCGKLSESSKI